MPSLEEYLAAELGIALVAGGFDVPDNVEALRAVGADAIARAIERGARDPRVGPACIELAVTALELTGECDLEEPDRFLAHVGHLVRAEADWVAVLVDGMALGVLEQLARTSRPPPGLNEALDLATPRLLDMLDGAHAREAMAVLAAIARRGASDLGAASPRIIAALADPATRWHAAEALGVLGDERAIDPLVALLRDPGASGSDKTAAAHALGRLQLVVGAPALAVLGRVAAPALVALVEASPPEHELADYVRVLCTLDPVLAAPAVVRVASPDRVNANVVTIAEAGARAGDEASRDFLRRAARGMPTLAGRIRRTLSELARE